MRAIAVGVLLSVVSGVAWGDIPIHLPDSVSALCIEAESGLILFEKDASEVRPPASMLKMMVMLLVSEGVEAGVWSLDKPITVSARAQSMGGSQVYLKAGEVWPLAQLMRAVAVASANDASVAVAEGLFGSVENCLVRMNERARELGMLQTTFRSVNGLPPDPGQPFDQTTALDMAMLARQCVQDPLVMDWVRQREFVFKPGTAPKYNTNKLLWRLPDCDGLKTGYIRAAGFCVTATAQRNGLRLISVVMGHNNKHQRFQLAQDLLEQGFTQVRKERVVAKGKSEALRVEVVNGDVGSVPLAVAEDVWLVAKNEDLEQIEIKTLLPDSVQAPQPAGTEVGEVQVLFEGKLLKSTPVILANDLERNTWLARMRRYLQENGIPTPAPTPAD